MMSWDPVQRVPWQGNDAPPIDAGDAIAALAEQAQGAALGKPEMDRRRFAKLARALQAQAKSANRAGSMIAQPSWGA
jgi:hypothetical protein